MTPILETRQSLTNAAADRWRAQYQARDGKWFAFGSDKSAIWERLKALGPHPLPSHVNQIVGNDSWTSCRCDQCNQTVDAVAIVGQEQDYESHTARLCLTCLQKTLALLESSTPSDEQNVARSPGVPGTIQQPATEPHHEPSRQTPF